MVGQHQVRLEASLFRLDPLVIQGLIEGRDPAVENGFHAGSFLSSEVLSGSGGVPKGKSEPSGQDLWGFSRSR
jgi:hypothetical protein